jgi:tetratricopeptide (TPR) repeat protein
MKLKRFIWIMSLVLITLCSHAQTEQVEQINLLTNYMGQIVQYSEQGLFKEALPFAEKAFQLTKELFGERHPYTLNTMGLLSSLYMKLGRLDEALSWSEKTYRLSSEVLGEKHPQTLSSGQNLAVIY